MITKQFRLWRIRQLTLGARFISMFVLGLFLFGQNGYAQTSKAQEISENEETDILATLLTNGSLPIIFENDEVFPWEVKDGVATSTNNRYNNVSVSYLIMSFEVFDHAVLTFEYRSNYMNSHSFNIYVDGRYLGYHVTPDWCVKTIPLDAGSHIIELTDKIHDNYWGKERQYSQIRNINLVLAPYDNERDDELQGIVKAGSLPIKLRSEEIHPWYWNGKEACSTHQGACFSSSSLFAEFEIRKTCEFSWVQSSDNTYGHKLYCYIDGVLHATSINQTINNKVELEAGKHIIEWIDKIDNNAGWETIEVINGIHGCVGDLMLSPVGNSDNNINEKEQVNILALIAELEQNGSTYSWDLSQGLSASKDLDRFIIIDGFVTKINLCDMGINGNIPLSLINFSKLSHIDLSHNNLTGNAGLLAAQLPNLTSLNLSYNQFSDLYPMISPNVTSLDISHQTINRLVPLNLSELKTEDIATMVPSILLYDHENQTYNPNINLLCTTGETSYVGNDDWAMQLAIYNGNIALPYVSPNNAYHGNSGDVLNVFDVKSGSSFKIALNFNQGDANFINGVDATDLQATILYAFGVYRDYPFNFTAANTYNKDDVINVQDIICTVNILLAQTVSQTKTRKKAKELLDDDAVEALIYIQDGNIVLASEKPVAAISLRAMGDIEWQLDKLGLTQTKSNGRVVGYSLTGTTLPAGETVIGTYESDAAISYASLADAQAQPITVALGENNATAIQEMDAAGENAQFYDVVGRKVNRLGKGINIIRNGSKNVKVIKGINK